MASSWRALCSDFYVNQKLAVKLDLPRSRETVLDLFERVRREFPRMQSFKRYREELALESPTSDEPHRWLAIRSNTIRSGVVNPSSMDEAYAVHGCVLEVTPYFLSISPLDVEYVELLYGFDLAAGGNHDAIVAQALLGESPLGTLLDVPGARPVDFQPVFGLALPRTSPGAGGPARAIEAHFEVKTRSGGAGASAPGAAGVSPGEELEAEQSGREEPISVYVTLRMYDPASDLKELPDALHALKEQGEQIVESRVLPNLVAPLREAIVAGGWGSGGSGGGSGGWDDWTDAPGGGGA